MRPAPVLQACLNGGRAPGDHPDLPLTADALAAQAALVWVAGAHGVHVHPRDVEGRETMAPGICAEAIAAIRAAAPLVEVTLSTREAIDPDVERRIHCVHRWTVLPDAASLNFWEAGAEALGTALGHRGVPIEAGVSSVEDAERLRASGLLRHCLRILVEIDEPEPQAAVAAAAQVGDAIDAALIPTPQLHHGDGRATWAVIVAASRAGRAIRIGLEDTLELPDGRPAPGNEAMVRAASELQRRAVAPTTP